MRRLIALSYTALALCGVLHSDVAQSAPPGTTSFSPLTIPLRSSAKAGSSSALDKGRQLEREKAIANHLQQATAALAQAESKRGAAKSALDAGPAGSLLQLKAKFRNAYADYLFAKIRLIRAQGWQQGKRGDQRKEVAAFLNSERAISPLPDVVDVLKEVSGS